jgi:hypothetical protein
MDISLLSDHGKWILISTIAYRLTGLLSPLFCAWALKLAGNSKEKRSALIKLVAAMHEARGNALFISVLSQLVSRFSLWTTLEKGSKCVHSGEQFRTHISENSI